VTTLPRRRFLAAAALLGAGVLEACNGHGPGRTIGAALPPPTTSTTTTLADIPPGPAADVLILQTASSIEHFASGVYTRLEGSQLITSPGVLDAVRFFADHHSAHGSLFGGATTRSGGVSYTLANATLSGPVEDRLQAMRTEADAVALAYGIEAVAAATYAFTAGQLSDPSLVGLMAGIGAVEGRHLAMLGTYLAGLSPAAGSATPPYPAAGFLGVAGAILPGVGL